MSKLFMSQKEFDKWVYDTVASYNNRGKEFANVRKLTIDPSENLGNTIIMNLKTGKTAVAHCHKDDRYVPMIGLAVAWAKYRNRPIPTIAEETTIDKLNFLDKFWFKRASISSILSENECIFYRNSSGTKNSFFSRVCL